MTKPTKSKLLELLKKHNFVKQDVAVSLGVDEKSVRRWCIQHKIDTDFEKKKSILEYEPLVVVPKTDIKKIVTDSSLTKLERVFVFSDLQIPYYNVLALNIALSRCRDYKPTHVVIIGDFLDYEALLGKAKQKSPDLSTDELKALDLEFLAGARVLKQIEQVLPSGCVKYFIKGNHEDRADQILIKPDGDYWKKHIDIDERLNLSGTGWHIVKYNDKIKLGKLNYTHGFYYDVHHAQHHARVYCENVIYGHTHQIQVFTMPTPARELAFWAASVGCLCDMNPEWLRGKPNSWDHAWAEIDYTSNGDFFPHLHRVIRGKVVIDGKLYKA
jgi:predicted phosphodiesterase